MPTTDTMPTIGLGWNPVTANLYGVPAFFSGDTPLSAVVRALQVKALQQGQGQGRDVIEVIPSDRHQGGPVADDGLVIDPATGRAVPRGRNDELRERWPGIPLPPSGGIPGIPEGAPGGAPSPGPYCSPFDVPCWFGRIFDLDPKDAAKRAGLVLVAIVLLAVALISMR